MRILHVSSLYKPDIVGGAEVLVEQLGQELRQRGHEVAVACLSRERTPAGDQDGIRVYRLGSGPVFFPMDWGKASKPARLAYKVTTLAGTRVLDGLDAAIADFRPDVVNTHSLAELSPMVWAVAAKRGIPIVHTLHDFAGLCTNSAMFRDGRACEGQHAKCKAWGTLHRWQSAKVDAVIGVGRDILARHSSAGHFANVRKDMVRVIWNPISPPEAMAPRRDVVEPVVFGYLGRIEASKGADLLLEACRMAPADGWRLVMAGKAVDGDAPYRAAAEGLPVTFAGFVDRERFFEEIDCLVAPPLWPEAFGRTVAEALVRGVPVVGADIAGVKEQVEAFGVGWLFKTGDARDLSQRMREIVANPKRLKMGASQISKFTDLVSPVSIAAQYDSLYEALLRG
ncbi:glycosyltransferase family 4 protein [Caulobacter sp. UC70_42]|uniref:glycosyltransferase family 4 protein n=1 Tax=Caulobacter sp. UC70_42 TaxID=3374551 RepID=UPI00375648F8